MKKLMLGNEGVARGAYEAGVRVAAAYPGTPSTEIAETIAKYDEVYAEWSPNEKVALETAIGASIGGARALVCMKHVGLNVAADPLFTVAYTGVNGGLVIVTADDPGMHSSQNEQDSRYYAKAAHIPMLEPADSQEAKDFTKLAYRISEAYDTPVLIRMTTRVSHSQSIVTLKERQEVGRKAYYKDSAKYVMMPGMARKRHIVVEKREAELSEAAEQLSVNRMESKDPSIGIIAAGIAYQYAAEALPDASILKLGMVHPLPIKRIKEFASRVKKLYVVEELEPILEDEIKSRGISVIGKELFSRQGELSAWIIKEKITGITPRFSGFPEELPERPPALCPGCPHRGAYYVMKRLNLTVVGDIGCYTLGALPPLNSVDASICMGASIGMALGMEKARGRDFSRKLIAVIGDSTFIHSGITGLIDVVYNQGITTVVILDNSTTGMTGHQDHPATGKNIKGDPAPILNLYALVKAIGIPNVRVVDPFDIEQAEKILKEETKREEPSVIFFQRPCVLLSKKSGLPCFIDHESCKSCGSCLRLGCPAILKKENRIGINQQLCNGCGLCQNVCRFHAIEGGSKE
ncbi:indolepyruvate ferredoxin oxidoreductase subunit alpha [Eubacteriales bacterium mix99]|nr:indolepyruvate ferredoxin oxidoreductase subunit alpha [Clostridiales bacterium]